MERTCTLAQKEIHGAHSQRRDRAAKEVNPHRTPGDGLRGGAEAAGEGSVWALPVSRRQDAELERFAGNESVALNGRVQQRRRRDRVGDEDARVSFRHAVELLRDDHPSLAAGDGRVVRKGTTVKLASLVAADACTYGRSSQCGRIQTITIEIMAICKVR